VRRVAAELAELGVLWLEEPLPAHDLAGLRDLRSLGAPRIAGGEMVRSVHELLACVEARALDVVQPDAILAVGMARACEVARRARAADLWFTPHTWTNGLGLAANLHVASAVDAGPYVEFPYDPPGWTPERRDPMLAEPLRIDADGFVACPDGPGLGVELDEKRLAAHRVG
jgi:L-alanine-DL-glutamate epimerase-like enolase superfamily enzyme